MKVNLKTKARKQLWEAVEGLWSLKEQYSMEGSMRFESIFDKGYNCCRTETLKRLKQLILGGEV